jgi:hypothetical protein
VLDGEGVEIPIQGDSMTSQQNSREFLPFDTMCIARAFHFRKRMQPPISTDAAHASSLHEAAARYLSRGWPVVPLAGKVPMIPWKEFQSRLPCRGDIDGWFLPRESSPTGLGIVTGNVSGLVVVDCDSRDDATHWTAEHGSSPLEVQTGGGGVHLYYAMPDGIEVRNRQGLFQRKIDLRGEGGYAVAPPSLHSSGKFYEWLSFAERVTLPVFDAAWLSEAHQERRLPLVEGGDKVRHALSYILKIHAVAGEGGHNNTFRAACKLRDAGLSKTEAFELLSRWNETNASPLWSAEELEHKIESAFKQGR